MQSGYIFIVGKADPQPGVAKAIRALGYKVGLFQDTTISVKKPENFDTIVLVDFSKLDDELIRLQALDLDVQGLQCTYENYVVAKAKIGAYFNVPSPSIQSARLTTDKALMRQAFIDADPTISPAFESVDSVDAALSFGEKYGYPVIIKPTNLVKSLLVLKCDDPAQLTERFTYALETIGQLYKKYNIYERAPQLIIEEFIVGEQFSIAAFVDSKGTPHFCDGIVNLKNAQDIGVDDNYLYSRTLPAQVSDDLADRMFAVAEAGIKALDMKSIPAHVELMAGPNGVKIIEIGARIGGYRPRMYDYTYGINLSEQEILLAIDEPMTLQGTFKKYCAVYELFPETEGYFDDISGNSVPEEFTYYRITAKKGSIVGPAKNGFKATAILIVTDVHKNRFDELCKIVDTMKVKLI
jgi:biotin carboxylase